MDFTFLQDTFQLTKRNVQKHKKLYLIKNEKKRLIKYSAVLYSAFTEPVNPFQTGGELNIFCKKAQIFNISCYNNPLQLQKIGQVCSPPLSSGI